MKLLILTTGNSFTSSMLYKENYLIKAAIERGHDVVVFANQYSYVDGKECKVVFTEQTEGYSLRRFPYRTLINGTITKKIRRVDGLESFIIEERPNLIFVNCAQVYNVKNLGKVKKALPNVKIVMDFSTKYLNSAHNWLSKNILHKVIYKKWIQDALPYTDRVFYISAESKDFAQEMYGISPDVMEHNNLPGETIPEEVKYRYRKDIRDRMNLTNEKLFMYSGKIYPDKKIDSLARAFSKVKDKSLRLLIIGSYTCSEEYESEVSSLINADSRIIFMNFVSGEELTKYVCACDLYIQPGSISQTCQTAVCCGTPLCFTDIPTHREIFNGNGFFADTEDELLQVIKEASSHPELLVKMSHLSYIMADEELDYKIVYSKILKSVGLV